MDLSAYEQGPLELKITPEGKTALVSVSPGFFALPGATVLVGAPAAPTAPSKEVFVNLETRMVETELDVGDGPSGIALTHDGSRAFVAHAGSTSVTVIDVKARRVVEQVDIGGNFAEAISLDDTDTVGIVTSLTTGSISKSARTFAVADMAGTLSPPVALGSDAAGVPFFPGTKTAYVVLAYNPLTSPTSGYAIIDASDPRAPVLLKNKAFTDSTYINFQGVPAKSRASVLVPVANGGKLAVREYALGAGDAELRDTFDIGPTAGFGAFGLVVDDAGHVVLTMPSDKMLAVLDLNSRNTFTVPWTSQPGPMGIDRR